MKKLLLLPLLALLALYSCRKEVPIASQGVQLKFSRDTVFLDTVFTTVGSSTYQLKVYNPSDETVSIDDIRLGRNQASKYRINVNGTAGKTFSDVEILPNDSIYVFVEVTASVIGSSESLLYTDSILFNNKGTNQNVKLVTLTQDAYFHYPTNFFTIGGQAIPYSFLDNNPPLMWDKPHVFYGYGRIYNQEITIPVGAELYFHNGSGLIIDTAGVLKVAEGANPASDSVTFAGDRLEPFYEDAPGQWGGVLGGIYVSRYSGPNIINNTVIKNATTALRLDSVGANYDQLTITNSHILNNSRIGIYGGYGNLLAINTVVANAGLHLFYAFGGNYDFLHCTFANYWNQSTRNTSGVALSNYLDLQEEDGTNYRIVRDLQHAYFGNCLVVGNNRSELAILKDESGNLEYEFQAAMIDVDISLTPEERGYDYNDPQNFKDGILINKDPDFVNYEESQYALDTMSQAVDGGTLNLPISISQDISGQNRSFNGIPDLGAYERQY